MASVASCTAPQQSIIMRKDIVSALVTPCTTSTQRGHGFGRILQDASAARTMLVGHCFSRTHAPQWLGPRWTPLVTFDLPPCKSAGAPAAQPVTVSPDWSASLLRCFWSPDGRLRMVKVCVCVCVCQITSAVAVRLVLVGANVGVLHVCIVSEWWGVTPAHPRPKVTSTPPCGWREIKMQVLTPPVPAQIGQILVTSAPSACGGTWETCDLDLLWCFWSPDGRLKMVEDYVCVCMCQIQMDDWKW